MGEVGRGSSLNRAASCTTGGKAVSGAPCASCLVPCALCLVSRAFFSPFRVPSPAMSSTFSPPPPPAPPPQHENLSPLDPGLLAAVARGEARLTGEQALDLLRAAPLFTLGRWADARC